MLLHAGSLYAGRTPVPLMRAIAQAIDRGGIRRDHFRLRFLGVNALKGVDLASTSRELGIEDVVEFVPRVPRNESLRAMMGASALLLLQPGHAVSVPGKVYEYLAAGRPIFGIAEGETSDLVERSGVGTCVKGDDEDAIAQSLTAMVNSSQAGVVPPARELYDGTMGAAQIADILARTIGLSAMTSVLTDAEVRL